MSSGPSVPDANNLSKAQTKSNIQTATAQTGLNAINQTGPGGSSTYKQIGTWPDGTPRFQQDTTLSPEMQGLYNTGVNTQQQIGNTAQGMARDLQSNLQPINQPQYQQFGQGPSLNTQGGQMGNLTSGVNGGPIRSGLSTNDYAGQRQQVEDELLGRVDKSYGRDLSSKQQQLANQGIQQGTEAYRNAMDDHNRSLADARGTAVLNAGQEQSRMQGLDINAFNAQNQAQAQGFGQGLNNAGLNNQVQQQRYDQTLGNAGFGNTTKQQQFQNQNTTTGLNNQNNSQGFQDQIAGNSQKVNQLLALLGGSQIQTPQSPSTPQTGINGTDVAGNAMNSYNAQQNQSNQFWSGLGSLGGTLGGFLFSDRRLKTDVRDTGMDTPGGVSIKDFRYRNSPMMMRGVMAQDVLKSGQRDAVAKTPSGFLAVDYKRVR
jgi:hypothetical protein